ncbi:hypothetical protein [uncultured Anaerobiospirillum sp.]|uniref:hypothetical protein n=1 Tax=uncultured Anaerobiospirillum sp. TaxID=265728 RepID=UPI002805D78A|nr:hypothetical protein [uncultured Anaerobiospirillum sp.]
MNKLAVALALAFCASVTGCNSLSEAVIGDGSETQVQIRSYQTKIFESPDVETAIKAVIATMQDIGFVIDNADLRVGTVTGTSFHNASRLSVTVRKFGDNQVQVRANAQSGLETIKDPIAYQNFFNSLSKSLFLIGEEVN